MENNQSKLSIFDFDKTLANTPERPEGWGGKGKERLDWWRHDDSLSLPKYDGSFNPIVLEAFKKAKADPQTKAVMLTGRPWQGAHMVRNHLQKQGLYGKRMISPKAMENNMKHAGFEHPNENEPGAHEEYYKGDHFAETDYPRNKKGNAVEDTAVFKQYMIEKLVNPQIQHVDLWEDRDEHVTVFTQLFKKMLTERPYLQSVIIHHVTPAGIKDIPLDKNSIAFN